MDLERIDQKVFEDLFRKLSKKALVYLKGGSTKQSNYDPFRDTGLVRSTQNPLPVKVLTKTISPDSLVFREMGLTKAGALQIILQDKDVALIKNAQKITISGVEYYVYDDAVGSRFQIFPTQFAKYSKIILFRKDT